MAFILVGDFLGGDLKPKKEGFPALGGGDVVFGVFWWLVSVDEEERGLGGVGGDMVTGSSSGLEMSVRPFGDDARRGRIKVRDVRAWRSGPDERLGLMITG